jgi:hypothetical protein
MPPTSRISERSLASPLKFVPRAIASVTRLGIVIALLQTPAMSVAIHPDRFARRKIGLGQSRRQISAADRESLKAQSNYCCACCGTRFSPRELVIDHLIPLSLLGAAEPANWVAMSKKHNATKWDRLFAGRPPVLSGGEGSTTVRRSIHRGRLLARDQREGSLFAACSLTKRMEPARRSCRAIMSQRRAAHS